MLLKVIFPVFIHLVLSQPPNNSGVVIVRSFPPDGAQLAIITGHLLGVFDFLRRCADISACRQSIARAIPESNKKQLSR